MVFQKPNSSRAAEKPAPQAAAGKERLHKLMARAGLGSRRACEQMILDGLVSVNDQLVSKLPVLVDPKTDSIIVQGQLLPNLLMICGNQA